MAESRDFKLYPEPQTQKFYKKSPNIHLCSLKTCLNSGGQTVKVTWLLNAISQELWGNRLLDTMSSWTQEWNDSAPLCFEHLCEQSRFRIDALHDFSDVQPQAIVMWPSSLTLDYMCSMSRDRHDCELQLDWLLLSLRFRSAHVMAGALQKWTVCCY